MKKEPGDKSDCVRSLVVPSHLFWIFFYRIEKREKYSRRRAHQDEADIDYINERNMKFNKKLARFYDPFTSEIKQNLERGTAI